MTNLTSPYITDQFYLNLLFFWGEPEKEWCGGEVIT